MCPLLLNVTYNKMCHFIYVCLILGAKAGGKCVFWFGKSRLGGGPGCGCAPIPSALNGWRLNAARKTRICLISGADCSVQDNGSRHATFPEGWVAAGCRICWSALCWGQRSPGCRWAEAGMVMGQVLPGGNEQAQGKQPQGFCCCQISSNLYDSTTLWCRLCCVRLFCTFLSSSFLNVYSVTLSGSTLRERPRALPTPLGERIEKDKLCLSAWAKEICGLVKNGRALPTNLGLINYTLKDI